MMQPADTRRLAVQQSGIGKNEAACAGTDQPDTLLEGALKKTDGFGWQLFLNAQKAANYDDIVETLRITETCGRNNLNTAA